MKLRRKIAVLNHITDDEIKEKALQVVIAYTQNIDVQRIIVARRGSNMLVNVVTKR